jgi:hypothetical protein
MTDEIFGVHDFSRWLSMASAKMYADATMCGTCSGPGLLSFAKMPTIALAAK